MKRFVLLIIICFSVVRCQKEPIDFNLIATDNLKYSDFDLHHSSWIKLDSLHRFSYSDIHFYNENVGILSGFAGLVFITKNGGVTWRTIDTDKDMSFHCIYALNENTFLAARLGVFKSIDGGSTWRKCNFPSETTVFDLWFKDSKTGFLSCAWGTYRTTDAGETWTKVTFVRGSNLQFTSENIGYFSCGTTSYPDFGPGPVFSQGKIFRTLDGGKTWIEMNIDVKEITGLSFISDKIGFFTTYDGGLYKTTDGGESCIKLETTLSYPREILFINEQQGYLCTWKGLLSTTDGGKTFIDEYSVVGDNHIYKFFFPSPNVGFAYDSHGYVLKRIQD